MVVSVVKNLRDGGVVLFQLNPYPKREADEGPAYYHGRSLEGTKKFVIKSSVGMYTYLKQKGLTEGVSEEDDGSIKCNVENEERAEEIIKAAMWHVSENRQHRVYAIDNTPSQKRARDDDAEVTTSKKQKVAEEIKRKYESLLSEIHRSDAMFKDKMENIGDQYRTMVAGVKATHDSLPAEFREDTKFEALMDEVDKKYKHKIAEIKAKYGLHSQTFREAADNMKLLSKMIANSAQNEKA